MYKFGRECCSCIEKHQSFRRLRPLDSTGALKDYRDHDFPNTEFSYFFIIDTRQQELSNYLLKNRGHRPLKGRYDVICNDVIFH